MALQILLFLGYAVLNTAAMAATKSVVKLASDGLRISALGYLTVGGVLYAAAIVMLLALLKGGAASTVYPIAIGTTVLASNAAGVCFYRERLTLQKLLGTSFVIAGIAVTYLEWNWL